MFRSTRSCRLLQVSRPIAGLRFSPWNQSSTSIDITAGGWSEPGPVISVSTLGSEAGKDARFLSLSCPLEQSVATPEEIPCVLARRKRIVRGFRHVERARNDGTARNLAKYMNHQARARDLGLGHQAVDAVTLVDSALHCPENTAGV